MKGSKLDQPEITAALAGHYDYHHIHPPMQNEESLEVILETIDPTEVAIVKSLLEAAGIQYLTRGEDQYDPFRGAFCGTVFSPLGRPVVFLVPASIAKEARLVLQHR